MTPPLIRGRVNRVRIAWINRDVGDAGVLANLQNRFPSLAAIGSLVESPISSRPPQRSLRGHVDSIRVLRIDRDAPDVLRRSEADVLPGFAAIVRPIDAIAVRDAALAVVLAGADP